MDQFSVALRIRLVVLDDESLSQGFARISNGQCSFRFFFFFLFVLIFYRWERNQKK